MNLTVLVQTQWWEFWPLALIVGLGLFFAWWIDTYTDDKY